MKKLMITCFVAFFGFATAALAQQDTTGYRSDQAYDESGDVIEDQTPDNEYNQDQEPVEQDIQDEADNSGDEIERIGKTGEAHIKDERLESKEGPEGETVFITEDGQYYYISRETGERVDVDKSDLKDKE